MKAIVLKFLCLKFCIHPIGMQMDKKWDSHIIYPILLIFSFKLSQNLQKSAYFGWFQLIVGHKMQYIDPNQAYTGLLSKFRPLLGKCNTWMALYAQYISLYLDNISILPYLDCNIYIWLLIEFLHPKEGENICSQAWN